jgi:hypothetical protein
LRRFEAVNHGEVKAMEASQSRGREFGQAAKDAASRAGDAVRQAAEDAVSAAREETEAKAAEHRDAAAAYLDDIAAAFDAAGRTLEERGRRGAAALTRSAKDNADRLRDQVSEHDIHALIDQVENFARRRPALFFGGAFLLGYAAIQFLSRRSNGTPFVEEYPYQAEDYAAGAEDIGIQGDMR